MQMQTTNAEEVGEIVAQDPWNYQTRLPPALPTTTAQRLIGPYPRLTAANHLPIEWSSCFNLHHRLHLELSAAIGSYQKATTI